MTLFRSPTGLTFALSTRQRLVLWIVGAVVLWANPADAQQSVSRPNFASPSTSGVASSLGPNASISAEPSAVSSAMSREQMFHALAGEAQRFEGQNRLVKQLIKVVSPTVAHIEARKRSPESSSSGSNRRTTESIVEEAGSGVVIERNSRFYVITNFHVIEGSETDDIKIEVDGRFYTPTRLLHDRDTDLSVMSLNGAELIPAHLGSSSQMEIGDFVVAVGSPFGLSHSVSFGIISALERHDLELGPKGVRYQDFIQTDAAINPGNSGGPLFNLRGETIGINTAIASNGGGSDGIGFAIPIDMVQRVVNDLIDYGEVRRGFLGVTLDARYNHQRARELGINEAYGALVSAITPNSPAAQAGIQVGDVILEFNNKRVHNDSHLVTKVSLTTLDSKVPVTLFRNGEYRNLPVEVKNRRDADWRSP